jgi:hypothetical protein
MDNNKMRLVDYLWAGFLFFLAMLAASCTYDRNEDLCSKGEPIFGTACIEIYDPVIAPDGTEYPNSCYAETDGWDNSCLVKKND